MSSDGPLLTNASAARFLYGSFRLHDGAWVFEGSVITGAGFTYDAATGLPVTGQVAAIALQTRSEAAVLAVHAHRACPDHDVAVLNHVYEDCPTGWFDPVAVFGPAALSRSEQNAPAVRDMPELALQTGDILTDADLRDIFGTRVRKLQRLARTAVRPDVDFWDIDPDGASAHRASA
ncbi:hypothetical protein [Pseudooctadecabacter sp.]|uniref:hypothetical protein n=1 Tax=Pseudooctadecabacter sp. TaxID=1966338 RepID=UPI0025D2F304|nr:hypothetical protein [Pseudooctadecabacter sp.]